MAPKYQIHYFPFQGLAEASRLILEHAGEPYENIIVQDWPKEKLMTPFGAVPVLRVNAADGTATEIAESHAIERFLALELGLFGSTSLETARLDMFHESWCDIVHVFTNKVMLVSDEEAKRAGMLDFAVKFTTHLKIHEATLKKIGPFYNGSKITLPDIYAYIQINRVIDGTVSQLPEPFTEESYPHLWALWKGVRESKGIKEYLESGRYELRN